MQEQNETLQKKLDAEVEENANLKRYNGALKEANEKASRELR